MGGEVQILTYVLHYIHVYNSVQAKKSTSPACPGK